MKIIKLKSIEQVPFDYTLSTNFFHLLWLPTYLADRHFFLAWTTRAMISAYCKLNKKMIIKRTVSNTHSILDLFRLWIVNVVNTEYSGRRHSEMSNLLYIFSLFYHALNLAVGSWFLCYLISSLLIWIGFFWNGVITF